MSDAVLVAIITGLCGVIGQFLISRSSNKKAASDREEKEKAKAIEDALWKANLEQRLKSVEHKLDVHNSYSEKLTGIQKSIVAIETEIKNLKEARV